MAQIKQLAVSLAALQEYQPNGQDQRYPFGAESLAKLDEFITLKITSPGYDQSEDIDLVELDIFFYKHFYNFGWFFGIASRFWTEDNVGLVQVDQNKLKKNKHCALCITLTDRIR
jgi:hypothetical protein